MFLKNVIFLLKINFFYILNYFDALILKIFKKKKNYFNIFGIKIILKNNHNYIFKQVLNGLFKLIFTSLILELIHISYLYQN